VDVASTTTMHTLTARSLALSLGILVAGEAAPASAGAERPVFVDVVGQGAIRLRLAAGRTTPCDSSSDRPMFDGWVEVGRQAWSTDADFVCYQYTSGALREQGWSVPQVTPTFARRGPAVIRISTD
jgi:hypothetical protein